MKKKQQKQTKTVRRLNPAVYGFLMGILFIFIGIFWILVVNLLIDIDGFGFGPIVNYLPIAGYVTIGLGLLLIFINIVRITMVKPIVKEEVQVAQKGVDPRYVVQSNRFEKKHIKGIILDLDGTLLDTLDDLTNAGNKALEANGFKSQTRENFRKGLGNGMYNLIKYQLPKDTDPAIIEKVFKQFVENYNENYNDQTKPYDGIKEMLEQLSKRGYLLAVISNKKQEFTRKLIKEHFGDILFVDVIGDKEGQPRKPDRSIADRIARKMILENEQLVIVGDSEVDIKTAKNAGMHSFAVTWGFRDKKQLKALKPDYLIYSPAGLVMELDQLNQQETFKQQAIYNTDEIYRITELELEDIELLEDELESSSQNKLIQ